MFTPVVLKVPTRLNFLNSEFYMGLSLQCLMLVNHEMSLSHGLVCFQDTEQTTLTQS